MCREEEEEEEEKEEEMQRTEETGQPRPSQVTGFSGRAEGAGEFIKTEGRSAGGAAGASTRGKAAGGAAGTSPPGGLAIEEDDNNFSIFSILVTLLLLLGHTLLPGILLGNW